MQITERLFRITRQTRYLSFSMQNIKAHEGIEARLRLGTNHTKQGLGEP